MLRRVVLSFLPLALVASLLFSNARASLAVAADSDEAAAPLNATHTAQRPSLDFDLEPNYLPRETASTSRLETLPDKCASNTECTSKIVATNVTFSDCGSAWTICRCEGENINAMPLDTAIDRLARVPVGLRRYVTMVMLVGGDGGNAHTLTDGSMHIFGDLELGGWLHESVHAFDFHQEHKPSSSDGWLDAIGNDTCAPDNYALSNAVEDFAQMGVVKLFSMAHYGSLPDGWDKECMKNQMSYVDALPVFDKNTLFGTCDMTWDGAPHQDAPPADWKHVGVVIPFVEDGNLTTLAESAATSAAAPSATEDHDGARTLHSMHLGWFVAFLVTIDVILR